MVPNVMLFLTSETHYSFKHNTSVSQCCTNVSFQGLSEPSRFLGPAWTLQTSVPPRCLPTSQSCPSPSRAAARQPQPGQDYKTSVTRRPRVASLEAVHRKLPVEASPGSCRPGRTRSAVPGRSRTHRDGRPSGCRQTCFQNRPQLSVP